MHAITANFQANPNIGLFCYTNNKYCLVPRGFPKKQRKEFEEVLGVPVHEINAVGTSLLGVFFNGNDDLLLVPENMFKSELLALDEYKIKYEIIRTELTAFGNNMLVHKKTCIINPEYGSEVIKQLEKLKFKVKPGKINELNTVGSLAVMNDKGILVGPDTLDFEQSFLKSNFKLNITTGTVNFGSPYIKAGVLCNNKGFVIGEASGGPEIQNVDEALGFLD